MSGVTQWMKKQQKIVAAIYEVPGRCLLTKTGRPCKLFNDWREKWHGKLERLGNGFIVFTPAIFSRDYIRTP